MSVEALLARVALLEQARSDPAMLLAATRAAAAPTAPTQQAAEPGEASAGSSFADLLQSEAGDVTEAANGAQPAAFSPGQAPGDPYATLEASGLPLGSGPAAGAPGVDISGVQGIGAGGATTGERMVGIAETQVGQAEEPLGSNESPAIAGYRSATAGAIPGAPWCAYFASWVARQAGTPLGPNGEGLGAVSEIWSWAQSSGRAIPNGPGVVPEPGDLIVFGDEHVGIVKDVLPDGDIQTIEGNYENKVAQNVRTPTEATGYVDMN